MLQSDSHLPECWYLWDLVPIPYLWAGRGGLASTAPRMSLCGFNRDGSRPSDGVERCVTENGC